MQRARSFLYVSAGIFLLAFAYHLGVSNATAQASRVLEVTKIRAKAIYLVDSTGTIRGQWQVLPSGEVSFGLGDRSGKSHITIASTADGVGFVAVQGDDDIRKAFLTVANGEPTLAMSGFRKEITAMLTINGGETPKLFVRDNLGQSHFWPSN